MRLIDIVCKELGVEIGENWTGNNGIKYRILPDGRIIYLEEGWGWRKLEEYEEIIAGILKPIWRPKVGDHYWLADPTEEDKVWCYEWCGYDWEMRSAERGMVFKTKDEAKEAANKMLDSIRG